MVYWVTMRFYRVTMRRRGAACRRHRIPNKAIVSSDNAIEVCSEDFSPHLRAEALTTN